MSNANAAGRWLRNIRALVGAPQSEIRDLLQKSDGWVSNVETGRTAPHMADLEAVWDHYSGQGHLITYPPAPERPKARERPKKPKRPPGGYQYPAMAYHPTAKPIPLPQAAKPPAKATDRPARMPPASDALPKANQINGGVRPADDRTIIKGFAA